MTNETIHPEYQRGYHEGYIAGINSMNEQIVKILKTRSVPDAIIIEKEEL